MDGVAYLNRQGYVFYYIPLTSDTETRLTDGELGRKKEYVMVVVHGKQAIACDTYKLIYNEKPLNTVCINSFPCFLSKGWL